MACEWRFGAHVGSHLGLRISNFVPKKPSNMRISTKNILTFDGSARGLTFKRHRLVRAFESSSSPSESTKSTNSIFSNETASRAHIVKSNGYSQASWFFLSH